MWEDVEGQENFPVSAGFELTTHELLVQEHNHRVVDFPPGGFLPPWLGSADTTGACVK